MLPLRSIIKKIAIEMIIALKKNNTGVWKVDWASNTFAGNWAFEWSNNFIKIKTCWRDEFEASGYLRTHNVLTTEKNNFLVEWKKILDILIENLLKCGYNIQNLNDMSFLMSV